LNYKETLYFIAKCLTISLEDKNRQEIEKQLQSDTIDWDAVVKVSTAHYVFPAMYCNLKRADFLQYLPQELVSYMEHITDINRERNKQIIAQAKELNNVLLANNIKSIFLKGTGNLLAGIYEDIGERMVGDIDFLFSIKDYSKAITVLREFGYSEVEKQEYYLTKYGKHYRRLQKENNIAAIEIHKDFLNIKKYIMEFNYSFVDRDCQIINGFRVLSYANKLNLSIIADQINDSGFYVKRMALRNAYDVFLLSKKTSAKTAMNTLDKLKHPLNCFLSACYEVFNRVNSLEYNKTKESENFLKAFNNSFNKRESNLKINFILFKINLFRRFNIVCKSIFNSENRKWLLNRIKSKIRI